MRSTFSKQTLFAAVALLAICVAVGFAETRKLEVKVIKGDSETVELNNDGAVELIKLDDLADGEERSFPVGEHALTVRRTGDELFVTMDGTEFAGVQVTAGHAQANRTWVGENGDGNLSVVAGNQLKGKRVIMMTSDAGTGGEHQMITVKCHGDEADDVDCEALENIDIEAIISDDLDIAGLREAMGEEDFLKHMDCDHSDSAPMVLKHVGDANPHMLRFHCTEDDTKLVIAKEKATQEHYLCPVCGREMEKLEAPELKIMTIIEHAKDGEELPN